MDNKYHLQCCAKYANEHLEVKESAQTRPNYLQFFTITISLPGASDSSIGCFWDRNPLLAQPCKIEFQWDLPLEGSFYCVDALLWPKKHWRSTTKSKIMGYLGAYTQPPYFAFWDAANILEMPRNGGV